MTAAPISDTLQIGGWGRAGGFCLVTSKGLPGTVALMSPRAVPRATGRGPYRVVVCENDPLMLAALCDFLEGSGDVEVVATAADAEASAAVAAETRPDAVILDVRMPKGGGVRAASAIRSVLPEARLIAFSAHADRDSVLGMLRAGASEYLIKGVDHHELVEAIRRTGPGSVGLAAIEVEQLLFEIVQQLTGTEARLARAESMLAALDVDHGAHT